MASITPGVRGPRRAAGARPRVAAFALLAVAALVANDARAQDLPSEPITTGQTISGTLSAADRTLEDGSYYDLYRFEAPAGTRVSITMRSADFDAYLALGRPAGGHFETITTDDDGAGGTDSRIVWTIEEGGVYLIRANSLYAGEVGAYTVTLEETTQPALQVRPINIGATIADQLTGDDATRDDGSHFHAYGFTAAAGDRFVVTLRSPDFDAYLFLGEMGAGGNFSALESDDDGAGGTDSRIRWTAPAAGSYIVLANTLASGETGSYSLALEAGEPLAPVSEDRALPIQPGQSIQGALTDGDPVFENGAHYDLYRFEARRGERFVITLRSGAFDAFLSMGWAEDGVYHEVASDDDGGGGTDSMIEWTAPGAGTYLIRATSYSAGRNGPYVLSLDRGN